eukprot:jgi/Chrzof1/12852/Cz07g09200.t1
MQVYVDDAGHFKHLLKGIRRGRQVRCTHCGRRGASLGCRVPSCPCSYHVACAGAAGCKFYLSSHLVACPEHAEAFTNEEPHHKPTPGDAHAVYTITPHIKRKKEVVDKAGRERRRWEQSQGRPKRARLSGADISNHVATAKAALATLTQPSSQGTTWGGNGAHGVAAGAGAAGGGIDDDQAEFDAKQQQKLIKHLAQLKPISLGRGVAAHQPGALDQPQFGVGFESVGGLSEVKRSLREMVLLPLCYPQLLHDMGITAPRGILLHGAPGTGKTAVVRALAGECSLRAPRPVALFARKGADCLGKYVGDAERTLRLLFHQVNGPLLEYKVQ